MSSINRDIAKFNLEHPDLFLRKYLPEWFPDTIPWFHLGIIAILTRRVSFLDKASPKALDKIIRHFVDAKGNPIFASAAGRMSMKVGKYTVIMMPRGFSKTTLFNGTNIWKIVHMQTKFSLYGSESGSHSSMQLQNIKEQLEVNELILKTYGNLVGAKWTQDDIETSTGVKVVSRGRGGQIRGLLRGSSRPDNIGLDDVEDEESVLTDAQRDKAKKWIMRSVMPALPRRSSNATFTMLGTLLHADAAMLTMSKDPRVTFIRFAAIDPDGEALWHEHMSLEQLENEKVAYSIAGDLSGFYMEYLSELSNAESSKFKNFIHGAMEPLSAVALAVDPAISNEPGADYFAVAGVGMGQRGRLFVLDVDGGRGVTPRAQVDMIFDKFNELHKLTGIRPIVGVEAISYQAALVHLLREEMFRKKTYFEIIPITHGRKEGKQLNKIKRVEGVLQPRYANGYVVHTKVFPLLELQLRDWPNGKKDFPDAVAMAVTLLDPFAASAADPDFNLENDVYGEDEDVRIGGAP